MGGKFGAGERLREISQENKMINNMTLDELYLKKGKTITNIQLLQTQLQNINVRIAELLQEGKNGSPNRDGNKK